MPRADTTEILRRLKYIKTDLMHLSEFVYGQGLDKDAEMIDSIVDSIERFSHIYDEEYNKI